jgi:hypothetical protein
VHAVLFKRDDPLLVKQVQVIVEMPRLDIHPRLPQTRFQILDRCRIGSEFTHYFLRYFCERERSFIQLDGRGSIGEISLGTIGRFYMIHHVTLKPTDQIFRVIHFIESLGPRLEGDDVSTTGCG